MGKTGEEDLMDTDLLSRLCNADAVAGREREVRAIMEKELAGVVDRIEHDGLGSALFVSEATSAGEKPLRIMFAAHMDEVGFMVRHISPIGMLHLAVLGGVLDVSKSYQSVRVTTGDGVKVPGILQATRDAGGSVTDVYVDLGVESAEEVAELGIEIGDMVTFASEAHVMTNEDVVAGKAMDDRTGLYVLAQAARRLTAEPHEAELWFAATSSEEVGTRGGKTACEFAHPDIFIAVDTASAPELTRDFTNQRKLGHGAMLVHFDKTMVPHEGLLRHVRALAREKGIPVQLDMFKGGGTDAANAHLVGAGRAALVIGVPLRYCHGAWSLAHVADLESAIDLVCEIARSFDRKTATSVLEF